MAISYEDLRRVLGYTRKGEEWETFKRRMNTIVKDISDLKATVRGIEIFGKQDGIAECAIFTISKVWHEQGELFGDMVQVGWLVDPGPWAKYFFNREAKPWQATLARTLLELDHRGVRRADVLALHIATLLFAVAGGTHYQDRAITRTVAELLELAGELPEPQHRGGHWARRTEAALSAALETMLQTGLLASVAFGAGYPTDPEDDPEDDDRDRLKRGKGWVERWLAAEVTMLAPDAAAYLAQGATDTPATTPPPARTPVRQTKATARLAKKRQDRKLDPGQRIDKATAARLRAAIKEQYGTQEIAAQFFKCTGATLSRALNGIHAPNPDLAKRLLALLDSPQEA